MTEPISETTLGAVPVKGNASDERLCQILAIAGCWPTSSQWTQTGYLARLLIVFNVSDGLICKPQPYDIHNYRTELGKPSLWASGQFSVAPDCHN
jgi:hypothetical protein